MSLIGVFSRIRFLPERILLQFFPPFLFMGVRVLHVAPDYRELKLKLPIRWYGRNMHGTLFGGFMCAVSDPLPTLLCERIFKGVQAWTQRNSVEFKRPARSTLTLTIAISEKEVDQIRKELDSKGEVSHTFEFTFQDARDHTVAIVSNTVYLRRKLK